MSPRTSLTDRISLPVARRIALAAQGFGSQRPGCPRRAHIHRLLDRVHLYQIDSVNVLTRAHYLPAYSRMGPYDRTDLDRVAWGPKREKRFFEYWAHEASLLPFKLHPLLRWRMAQADRGDGGWSGMRPYATERRAEAMAVLERIRVDGPLAASDFEEHKGQSGWWEWSDAKRSLEWLFWAGHISTATRRASFERSLRSYGTCHSGGCAGATHADRCRCAPCTHPTRGCGTRHCDYRRPPRLFPSVTEQAAIAIQELLEDGVLLPVEVPGWRHDWLHRDARHPRRIDGQALLAPFDPLIWTRARAERLFGFRYRIEIYVPAQKRQHGYYVLPFLLGDRLVARVNLKADRREVQPARAINPPRAGCP